MGLYAGSIRLGYVGLGSGVLAALVRRALAAALAVEHAERFELAMQRRALHADKSRGTRDIPAKTRDLGEEIFALEHLARVAQRQGHDLAAATPAHDGRRDRADLGRQHLGADRIATGR